MPLVLPATGARWTWDFGDGTPRVATREPAHTYYRAGTFVVRAFAGTRELARTRVEVAPRPVPDALPEETTAAVWIDGVDGEFEAAIDALERLAGTARAGEWLEAWTLPARVLEWRAGAPAGAGPMDPDDAVGLFRLRGYDGVVAFAGVADADQAQRAVLADLTDRGGAPASHPEGGVQLTLPDGRAVGVLLDRGYLYVAVPAAPAGVADPELAALARGPEHDPARVFAALRAAPDARAGTEPTSELPWPATVHLLWVAGPARWRGAARMTADALEVDAQAASIAPGPEEVGEPPALAHVGETPPPVIGAAGVSLAWLLARMGWTPSPAHAAVLAALAPGILWTAEPDEEGGSLHAEASARDAPALRAAASRARLRVLADGARVELETGREGTDRSPAPLLHVVQVRHADGAFGPGHVSVELDGEALRAAAASGRTLRFAPLDAVPWSVVDRLFVDVAAEQDGLHLRARADLRPE